MFLLFAMGLLLVIGLIGALVYRQISQRPKHLQRNFRIGFAPVAPAKNGFSAKKIPSEVDVVVIGSGIGGLTAASLLAQQGKRVLVLEQHDVAGGCTHTFELEGHEFDTGLHYVGGRVDDPKCGTRMLFDTITGCGLEWHEATSSAGCFDEAMLHRREGAFGLHKDIGRCKAELCARFPSECDGIERYFALLEEATASSVPLFVLKLLPRWLASFALPLFSDRFSRYAGRTVSEVLAAEVTSNKELGGILTYCWGDYGLQPDGASFFHHAMIARHYFGGSFYPVGGPAQIARCCVPIIEQHGGAVLVRAPVEEILTLKGVKPVAVAGVKVRGHTVVAPVVVAACGLRFTLKNLLPKDLAETVFDDARATLGIVNKSAQKVVRPSASLATLFVGLEGDPESLGLSSSNLWIFPTWDHTANVTAWSAGCKAVFEGSDGAVTSPAAVFVSCSSAKDPTWEERFGEERKTSVTVIAPVDFERFAAFEEGTRVKHRGPEYDAIKERLSKVLLEVLHGVCPSTRGKVLVSELGTPLSNNFYLGVEHGECYGLECDTERWRVAHQTTWARCDTPVKGLFFCGQDVFSPGISGAALSGLWCAAAVSPRVIWDNLGTLVRL